MCKAEPVPACAGEAQPSSLPFHQHRPQHTPANSLPFLRHIQPQLFSLHRYKSGLTLLGLVGLYHGLRVCRKLEPCLPCLTRQQRPGRSPAAQPGSSPPSQAPRCPVRCNINYAFSKAGFPSTPFASITLVPRHSQPRQRRFCSTGLSKHRSI